MGAMITFLSNREIYERVICGMVPQAQDRLWIATADIKDMYVDSGESDRVPFDAAIFAAIVDGATFVLTL